MSDRTIFRFIKRLSQINARLTIDMHCQSTLNFIRFHHYGQ